MKFLNVSALLLALGYASANLANNNLRGEDSNALSEKVSKPCCSVCEDPKKKKYYSIVESKGKCGECCMHPEHYHFFKIFEPGMLPVPDDVNNLCESKGFTQYLETETHGFGPISMELDMYSVAAGVEYEAPAVVGNSTACIDDIEAAIGDLVHAVSDYQSGDTTKTIEDVMEAVQDVLSAVNDCTKGDQSSECLEGLKDEVRALEVLVEDLKGESSDKTIHDVSIALKSFLKHAVTCGIMVPDFHQNCIDSVLESITEFGHNVKKLTHGEATVRQTLDSLKPVINSIWSCKNPEGHVGLCFDGLLSSIGNFVDITIQYELKRKETTIEDVFDSAGKIVSAVLDCKSPPALTIVAEPTIECCYVCDDPEKSKYYSIDLRHGFCGEACMKPEHYRFFKLFEYGLTPAENDVGVCFDLGYPNYDSTVTHGLGPVSITLDLFAPESSTTPTCKEDIKRAGAYLFYSLADLKTGDKDIIVADLKHVWDDIVVAVNECAASDDCVENVHSSFNKFKDIVDSYSAGNASFTDVLMSAKTLVSTLYLCTQNEPSVFGPIAFVPETSSCADDVKQLIDLFTAAAAAFNAGEEITAYAKALDGMNYYKAAQDVCENYPTKITCDDDLIRAIGLFVGSFEAYPTPKTLNKLLEKVKSTATTCFAPSSTITASVNDADSELCIEDIRTIVYNLESAVTHYKAGELVKAFQGVIAAALSIESADEDCQNFSPDGNCVEDIKEAMNTLVMILQDDTKTQKDIDAAVSDVKAKVVNCFASPPTATSVAPTYSSEIIEPTVAAVNDDDSELCIDDIRTIVASLEDAVTYYQAGELRKAFESVIAASIANTAANDHCQHFSPEGTCVEDIKEAMNTLVMLLQDDTKTQEDIDAAVIDVKSKVVNCFAPSMDAIRAINDADSELCIDDIRVIVASLEDAATYFKAGEITKAFHSVIAAVKANKSAHGHCQNFSSDGTCVADIKEAMDALIMILHDNTKTQEDIDAAVSDVKANVINCFAPSSALPEISMGVRGGLEDSSCIQDVLSIVGDLKEAVLEYKNGNKNGTITYIKMAAQDMLGAVEDCKLGGACVSDIVGAVHKIEKTIEDYEAGIVTFEEVIIDLRQILTVIIDCRHHETSAVVESSVQSNSLNVGDGNCLQDVLVVAGDVKQLIEDYKSGDKDVTLQHLKVGAQDVLFAVGDCKLGGSCVSSVVGAMGNLVRTIEDFESGAETDKTYEDVLIDLRSILSIMLDCKAASPKAVTEVEAVYYVQE